MPSGNAIYTYTGPEESTEIQGQIFLKDQPKHITDQGVIAVCAVRKDFVWHDPDDAPEWTADDFDRAEIHRGDKVIRPAKPKKAKSK